MKLPFGITISRARRETAPAAAPSSSPNDRTSPYYGDYSSVIFSAGSSNALGVATAYRCIDVISSTVASIQFDYLKRTGGVYRRDEHARLNYLLTVQPNPYMSAYEFKAQLVRQILTRGEALIVPVYSDVAMDISYLFLVTPGNWSMDAESHTYNVFDSYYGLEGTYDESEVLHIMNFTTDGKRGVSVISQARLALATAATGDTETYNRFANGGTVRGIVGNDNSVRGFGEYADKELNKTAEDLDAKFRQGQRIVSLPGQVQFNQLSMSSVDMEFLNTRKFSVREICRFFGVPPTFVYDDTSNNYKSAEMASVSFMSQTIGPLLAKIENEFVRKLIAEFRFGRYTFQFDRKGAYALDLLTKASYQKQTIESGVFSINDWRRYENMPEVENGDRVLVSANLKSLDALLAENTEPSAPVQESGTDPNTDNDEQ